MTRRDNAGHAPEIVLDLSRLVSRFRHEAPTGVDRVELAYAREMLALIPERLSFAAVHPAGRRYGRIATPAAIRFIRQTEVEWGSGRVGRPGSLGRWWRHVRTLWSLRPRRVPAATRPRVLVQSSPHHLDEQAVVERILRREGARLVCLLHDLIPVEYPEYARPGGDREHLKRICTIARLASAVVANSQATLDAFAPHLRETGRTIPMAVAHLGLDGGDQRGAASSMRSTERPYFIIIGTIEPRKNHLLLLHLWRRLAEVRGPLAIPKLIVIGRRGWENEQVVDLLERCGILRDCVEERGRVSDETMRELLSGARALLLPSFAEGYGMPVPEALAAGVPVLCSDLPALKEAGGTVPDYLDPLDGRGWTEAILDYADPASPRRQAQMERMRHWTPPSWLGHIELVLNLTQEIGE